MHSEGPKFTERTFSARPEQFMQLRRARCFNFLECTSVIKPAAVEEELQGEPSGITNQ